MKFKAGINFQLALLGLVPAGLIGLALAAYFIHTRYADLDRNLDARGNLIIHQLAEASVSILADDYRPLLQDVADAALQENDVIQVSIIDRQGVGVTASREPASKGYEESLGRLVLAAPIYYKPSPRDSPNANAGIKPEVLGSIRLVLSKSSTYRLQRETMLFSLFVLVAGLLSTALLARRMGRKISGPVRSLILAVHELSKGNLDARAETEAEAELAYLQAGFNAMAAELKKNRDSLESQVQQATLRLREALGALEKRNLELESARKFAEQQAELKSRFLAQMSHEIRTPMNGIIGFAELLAKTPLREEQAEKLGLITRSAKNLLAIINEILDFSRLESGWVNLNVQSFELRPCLEDVIALLSARVRRPCVVLWMEAGVPSAIEGDAIRLQQILANLLGNALKFTQRGRVVLRVRLRRERLWFSVSDSGRGISPRDMAELWSASRPPGENALHSGRGTGLGLAIVKNIVDSMGGAIHSASRLGKGTSFWFDMPLKEAPLARPVSLPQCRAILIEPDRLCRQALCRQMESLGASVEAFASYMELAGHLQETQIADVLLYGFRPDSEKQDAALPLCLQWCLDHRIKPILLFPGGERRMIGFYRKLGTACLSHPLRSETLAKAMGSSGQYSGQPLLEPQRQTPANSRRLKFLLADDNEINRLLTREQLGRFDAEIIEAKDGAEAISMLRQHAFDLALLDLQMPVLDGRSVLRMMHGHSGPNRHTPAIAMTAFSDLAQREAMIREGFVDCLVKPILEEQLAKQIEALLPQYQAATPKKNSKPGVSAHAYAAAIVEKTGGNGQLASVIARKLFAELPKNLHMVETAIRNHEAEVARRTVHMINGAVSFSGLAEIGLAAAELETALAGGEDFEILQKLCRQLAGEIGSFLNWQGAILDLIKRAAKAGDDLGV